MMRMSMTFGGISHKASHLEGHDGEASVTIYGSVIETGRWKWKEPHIDVFDVDSSLSLCRVLIH